MRGRAMDDASLTLVGSRGLQKSSHLLLGQLRGLGRALHEPNLSQHRLTSADRPTPGPPRDKPVARPLVPRVGGLPGSIDEKTVSALVEQGWETPAWSCHMRAITKPYWGPYDGTSRTGTYGLTRSFALPCRAVRCPGLPSKQRV